MSDLKFDSWSVPQSAITIEYSLVAIEEIRHAVAEGFQRLSRGGIEVGGILYGTRDDRTVRIQAMRPIACEHARGPAFLLSDKDRKALNEQIAAEASDPQLDGLISVGWYLSHTRSDISLSDSDLEVYSIFFPAPWQVTLVVRPGRGGSMRAGFFMREPDGSVNAEHSYLDFDFPDRLAGLLSTPVSRFPEGMPERPLERLGERRRSAPSRTDVLPSAPGPVAALRRDLPEAVPPPTFGQPAYIPTGPPKKKWPWLIAWAFVVILAGVFAWRYWFYRPVVEPISLSVVERDGQLRIEWNHASHPVAAATRGTLVINDGHDTQTFALSPRDLTQGSYTYARKSGDVEVRMLVEDGSGGKVQEASRFLGQPAAKVDPGEISDLKKQRDDLQEEVDRLTRQNRSQQEKIKELQRTLQIMQARSGK
ncbi:MAG TPA: hypothetical protein VMT15_01710 [Bryobacteraceae bacterium]|nr:hypothetical protein [Bryobacteraceae bacterium]